MDGGFGGGGGGEADEVLHADGNGTTLDGGATGDRDGRFSSHDDGGEVDDGGRDGNGTAVDDGTNDDEGEGGHISLKVKTVLNIFMKKVKKNDNFLPLDDNQGSRDKARRSDCACGPTGKGVNRLSFNVSVKKNVSPRL